MILLIILFNLLNIFDILITKKFLSLGIKELNPIIKLYMEQVNDKWWIPKIVSGLCVTYVFLFVFSQPTIIVVICIILFGVCCWNLYQIKKRLKQKTCCS
jgi:hypothetical protein